MTSGQASQLNVELFGAVSMGYVLIESQRLERWRDLLQGGLGLHLAENTPEQLAFRLDAHQRRIVVRRGSAEDVIAAGWQLRSQAALEEVLWRLSARGIPVAEGSLEEARQRAVAGFWRFVGPKGMVIELFTTPQLTDEPLHMLSQGFVTGEAGLGHLAITSKRAAQMRSFWQEIFDARHSDTIIEHIAGLQVDIDFLRLNPRHHSIAIAAVPRLKLDPIRTRIQHMNLLTTSLDELSAAFRRCRELGFEMAHEIGQHPNDKELSFYVISPSDFEMELGWNALVVDEASWRPKVHRGISLWGHKPQKSGAMHMARVNLSNFVRAARSALKHEYSPMSSDGTPRRERSP